MRKKPSFLLITKVLCLLAWLGSLWTAPALGQIMAVPRWNAFFKAVDLGKLEQVRELLKADRSAVTALTYDGLTALHIAADGNRNHADMARLLLNAGADPNARSKNILGRTPLHLSAGASNDKNRNDVLPLLIAAGARVDTADLRQGRTALHVAVEWGYVHNAARLLKAGANPNALDEQASTPLHLAMHRKETSFELVQLLLASGAKHHLRDKYGDTPLHIAAFYADLPTLAALLKAGANANAVDKDGETPLHVAARNNQAEAVRELLKRMNRQAIFQKSQDAETALDNAARTGNAALIELLMEQGLPPTVEQLVWLLNRGAHAAANTLTAKHPQLVQALGADIEAAFAKVMPHHKQDGMSRRAYQVHALLFLGKRDEAAARLRAFDKMACGQATPLMDAVERKDMEAAQALLDLGADPNAQPPEPTRAWLHWPGPNSSAGLFFIHYDFPAPCKMVAPSASAPATSVLSPPIAATAINPKVMLDPRRFARGKVEELSLQDLKEHKASRASRSPYLSSALVMSVSLRDLSMTKLLLKYGADAKLASMVPPSQSAQSVWLAHYRRDGDAAQWQSILGISAEQIQSAEKR